MFKNLRIRQKMLVGYAIPILLMVVIAGLVTYNIKKLVSTAKWVDHTQQVMADGSELSKLLVDMETGERGFLIAGKEEFLEPFNNGQKSWDKKMGALKQLVNDNPAQVARLTEIDGLKNEWLKVAANVEIAERRKVVKGAKNAEYLQAVLKKGRGKNILDGLRSTFDRLDGRFKKAGLLKGSMYVLSLAKDMVDQETGERGFLITGVDSFLQPYREGRVRFRKNLTRIEAYVNNSSAITNKRPYLRDIKSIRQKGNDWRKFAAEPEINARHEMNKSKTTMASVIGLIEAGAGKAVMDSLRVKIDKFVGVEATLMGGRKKEADTAAMVTMVITVLGTLIAIVIALIGAFVISNTVSKPLNRAIQILGDLANGKFSRITDEEKMSEDESGQVIAITDNLMSTITTLIEEITTLSQGIIQGQLDAEGDMTKVQGEYQKVIGGMNQILGAVRQPIQEIMKVMQEMAKGNLNIEMEGDYQGQFADFQSVTNKTLATVKDLVTQNRNTMQEMAKGNLNIEMKGDFQGDFAQIQTATNETINSLNNLIGQVSSTTQQVTYGADQISDSSQNLSRGASESASSLEEISASMVQIESKTKENSDNSDNAFSLSEKSQSSANTGAEKMNEMVTAMEEIRVSGTNISKIIKVINDIAFQTNLLSLNAAVEAARAGSHGKGFAVVADEVRNLAHRSAKAADETNELIQETINKVEVGSTIADETSKCLEEIVTSAKEVSELVGSIKESSQEQARSTAETAKGLENINAVTQSNSSNSEESARLAEELTSQASQLQEFVSQFKLKEKYRLQHKSENKETIMATPKETKAKSQNGGPKTEEKRQNGVPKAKDVSIVLDDVNFEDFSKTIL